MYHSIQEFLEDWENESAGTIKMLKNLTDASLNQKVTEEGRSLGFLAWHFTISIGDMGRRSGLKFNAPADDAPVPALAEEITTAFENSSQDFVEALKAQWNDAMLEEIIEIYGEKWKRGFVLGILITHLIHHRGQMTVLMRQAGLKVPGLYGPSKEEWVQYGMPPQP
jgi:uncharacterized damage-inducible protein DinB